jgi:hypothetical protein
MVALAIAWVLTIGGSAVTVLIGRSLGVNENRARATLGDGPPGR